jgi:hypothetical protein
LVAQMDNMSDINTPIIDVCPILGTAFKDIHFQCNTKSHLNLADLEDRLSGSFDNLAKIVRTAYLVGMAVDNFIPLALLALDWKKDADALKSLSDLKKSRDMLSKIDDRIYDHKIHSKFEPSYKATIVPVSSAVLCAIFAIDGLNTAQKSGIFGDFEERRCISVAFQIQKLINFTLRAVESSEVTMGQVRYNQALEDVNEAIIKALDVASSIGKQSSGATKSSVSVMAP